MRGTAADEHVRARPSGGEPENGDSRLGRSRERDTSFTAGRGRSLGTASQVEIVQFGTEAPARIDSK